MTHFFSLTFVRRAVTFAMTLWMSTQAFAQSGPTAADVASQMTIGWNIGNTLEVPKNQGGETGWGNPAVTQQLINAVKDAGFNTIRIPCAWDSYADPTTHVIDPTWLARVKQVVDYCIGNNMFVVLNIHWDGGWLEEHPLYAYQASVNEKQNAYWTQIANYFKTYDEHLLFAGTNEVHADYGTPTAEHIEVQQSYNQTFVNAVRATGGNNLNRILIVQTYNTNISHGLNYFTMPTDAVSNRLIVEVHNYDPYDFTLNASGSCIYWGSLFPNQSACNWAQESYMDDLFAQVKTKWTSHGIPVIMGEYGVIKRTGLSGQQLADHIAAREYYLRYVTEAAVNNGVVPIYWDNGFNGENGMALFNRSTGAVVDQGALDALMEGAGVGNPNTTYTITTSSNGSGSVSLNPPGGSYNGGTSVSITAVPNAGWDFVGWTGDLSGSTNPATISISSNMSITANFTQEGTGGSGTILREYWTGITGTAISALTSNSNYPSNPTGSEQLTSLEGPVNWADNYGTRIRGYVHPPVTGTYTFWVAGDDYTDFYLSTDDTPAHASRIAYVPGWTNSREWTKYPAQTTTVNLTGGQRYYIEVLHKEGSGGDNVAVAWQGPGFSQRVIEGAYLSPFDAGSGPDQFTLATSHTGSGTIGLSPSGGTYNEGTVVTLTATPASGWQFNGWGGDLNGSSNPTTIVMNSNHSVSASFTQIQNNQYTLTATASGSGGVSLSPSGGTYSAGTVVTVTATAGSGWHFNSWSGDLSGTTNPSTITMSANRSITANFAQDQTGTPCNNPVTISLPFSHNGAGEFCWVTSGNIAYVNSWNMALVEINGVSYTNTWSNSMPARVNGNYYIHYVGNFPWSHFEAAAGSSGARIANSFTAETHEDGLFLYPNPFTDVTNLTADNPVQVKDISITDLSGREIGKASPPAIGRNVEIGRELSAGMYILRVTVGQQVRLFRIVKR